MVASMTFSYSEGKCRGSGYEGMKSYSAAVACVCEYVCVRGVCYTHSALPLTVKLSLISPPA